MGQKVHPYGFRLGYTKPWKSRWFAERDYDKQLLEDVKLKAELKEKLKSAGVSSIEIERPGNKLRIIIKTARPGIIIGRKGAEIDKLKAELQKRTAGKDIFVDIQEVHKPELDAQLVSESIALQLEKRVGFRRAMRKAVDSALRFGCKGIKVRVSGRLNGNEIARSEWYLQGRLPLHTLRADIEYGFSEARTTYGVIGVKAWLYKGEILDSKSHRSGLSSEPEPRRMEPRRDRDRDRDRDRRREPQPQPVAAEPGGPATQSAPSDLPRPARSGGPLMPPLMAPQPSWKQEARTETPAAHQAAEPAAEPAGSEPSSPESKQE